MAIIVAGTERGGKDDKLCDCADSLGSLIVVRMKRRVVQGAGTRHTTIDFSRPRRCGPLRVSR